MSNEALPSGTAGDARQPPGSPVSPTDAVNRAADYSRDLLRAVIETNTDLILSVDPDCMVTFANGGFLGDAEARRVMNVPAHELVTPENQFEFKARCRAVLEGRERSARLELDGAGVLAGRHCLFSIGALRGVSEGSGLIIIVSDLTELHEAWEQLRNTEKLVATGRMAARIAHEINNPLAGIAGALQLIRMDTDPASPAFRYVAMVDREISRISNIVRQMYGLYRQDQEPAHVVDLIPVLGEIAILMNVEARQKNVEIEVMPGAPQLARVQEQNLRQVLLNIVRNAIEASPEGGRINLYVERSDHRVDIVVVDEGPGIKAENSERVFEPFFTSKSSTEGRGLGLGLSISDALVRGMGGRIELKNRQEGGCACRICLPEAGDVPDGQA